MNKSAQKKKGRSMRLEKETSKYLVPREMLIQRRADKQMRKKECLRKSESKRENYRKKWPWKSKKRLNRLSCRAK